MDISDGPLGFCLCDFFFITGADELVIRYSVDESAEEPDTFEIEAFKEKRQFRLTDQTLEANGFISHSGESALREIAELETTWKPNVDN